MKTKAETERKRRQGGKQIRKDVQYRKGHGGAAERGSAGNAGRRRSASAAKWRGCRL